MKACEALKVAMEIATLAESNESFAKLSIEEKLFVMRTIAYSYEQGMSVACLVQMMKNTLSQSWTNNDR